MESFTVKAPFFICIDGGFYPNKNHERRIVITR